MVILSEFVQGSTSQRYDVFLSFRGSDTRNNFTDHLYNALIDADIDTFLDDEEIETGEDLKPELEDAIRSSRASVIVLSKNYPTSTWCLDELALILERRLTADQIVIPIFYHVEPTDLRKQLNSFGDAMAEHRQKMEAETNAEERVRWCQKLDRWDRALTDVADLKGKDVKGRKETDFIEEIVTEIRQRLGVPLSATLPLLIGRYHHIEEITSWLTDGSSSHTFDILTVSGMGGIGKTTLAKYVFHLLSSKFDKSSFIEGINLKCTEKYNGLLDVQRQLYDDISKKRKRLVHDTCVCTSKIEKALIGVKVFLVLDDIDSLGQLDALLGNKGFHPGSKIIITTRNASLTERCALFKLEVEPKHTKLEIKGLYETAALTLLCLHAFKCKDPKEGYDEVLEKLVKYCEGHPLALEVLGKTLYNRDVDEWEDYIETIKKETDPSIKKVLQISFNSLPSENDKELFKHIACFFVGKDRDYTETILKACNINTRSGIRNLVDRCFLSIGRDNELMMHQLLQEMGRDEVHKESPHKPWKRSRLWNHEESYKVLKQKKNMENILGLTLDTRVLEKEKLHGSFELKTDVLSKMDNIILLQLNYVEIKGTFKNFPEELRWLCMHGFPLNSLPSDLPLDNLVALDMSYSNIESFGGQKLIRSCSKDKRILGSLKILDLSFCEQLHKLNGFYEVPKLERLIVRNCIRMYEICESLEECVELIHIDLSYCIKLEKLPIAMSKLKKVETLTLDGCNIFSFVEEIPSDSNLCVISLPRSLVKLCLVNSNLTNESFPVELSCLSRLKYLCLDKNPIVSMPSFIRSLCRLEELSMAECKTLMSIEHPPCTLRRLIIWIMHGHKPLLQRILFDPDMSPISIEIEPVSFRPWSYEIEGMVKIQPLEGIEEKMYYEFGIFSTIYGGQAMMPDWISWSISSQKTPISFTIPLSPKKQLKGLNFCYVQRRTCYGERSPHWIKHYGYPADRYFELPVIEISNKTKNRTWEYTHCIQEIDVGGEWYTYLSHWMFGMMEMETGDKIVITMNGRGYNDGFDQHTKHCGVSFVYDDGRMEDDALEYYKSWNHIIGADLSSFQLKSGQYSLSHPDFIRYQHTTSPLGFSSKYKELTVPFRAFSKRKVLKLLKTENDYLK